FAANSFINLVITLGIFAWAVQRYPEPISAGRVVLFLLLILNGNLIFYCMNMLANLPVFWAHSGQGFGSLMWSINKFAERPDRIYSGIIRRILTTTLPFCLIASFPTRLLLEPMDYKILLHTLLVSAAFFAVLIWCWNLALRHYSSASS
ncbi:MAG: ABC-2 family transporter protein, partial [Bdellovibrionales bacterium]